MTWNVASSFNPIKRRRLVRFIIKEKIDLICIQETHLKDTEIKHLRAVFMEQYIKQEHRVGLRGC